jgi:hypothetical protein
MNAVARLALWERLRAAGVVERDLPADDAVVVPWYVRAMIGTAAWIAALFVMGSILALLSGLFRNSAAMVAIGLVLCAIAVVVMRAGAANVFVAQFAFALSLAGQGLFVGGWFAHADLDSANAGAIANGLRFLVVLAFEACLVLLAPAYVHRVLCTLAAAIAFGGALVVWKAGVLLAPILALGYALAALRGTRDGELIALWQPVVAGLALALAASVVALVVATSIAEVDARLTRSALLPWTGQAAMTVAFGIVIALLLRDAGVRSGSRAGIAVWLAAGAVAAAAWFVSGLLAAGLVLLVAFAIGHEVLVGLGVITLLATLSRYYYGLEATLLVKSASLCATGIALLAARYGMRFVAPAPAEADHA